MANIWKDWSHALDLIILMLFTTYLRGENQDLKHNITENDQRSYERILKN